MNKKYLYTLATTMILLASAAGTLAQTTAFNYQGRLTDGGSPANGSFLMQFKLFDALAGGTQIGSTLDDVAVVVTNGSFSTRLDFGSGPLTGANRWLEIAVRRNSGEGYVTLSPREQIASSPYSVRTVSAAMADDSQKLGGVNASQFVQTGDSRLSDSRNPLPGSSNYIQNSNLQQAGANFNIGGNGTAAGTLSANVVNAASQYNLGNAAILKSFALNLFVGQDAGRDSGVGDNNSYFGWSAGKGNVSGNNNSIFGSEAGPANTGSGNSFFGASSGLLNTSGVGNSFFGQSSGRGTTTGASNSFFGNNAGLANQQGGNNSYFGSSAGRNGTTGSANSFFGLNAGYSNLTGGSNTAIGANSDFGSSGLSNANAIGTRAFVSASNSLVLGSIAGVNGATFDTRVGIGTTAPDSGFELRGSGLQAQQRITDSVSGNSLVFQSGSGSSMKITGYHYGTGQAVPLYLSVDGANTILNSGGGNVGIGTATPGAARLKVVGGNIFVTQPNSLIITSANGACWFLTVNNSGALVDYFHSVPLVIKFTSLA